MALDAGVLADIRQWVGTRRPTDADLEVRYLRLGSVTAVALQVLRERLADMLIDAAKFDADGDASYDYSANLKLLESKVHQLEASTPPPADPDVSLPTPELSVGRIVRSGRSR